MLLVEENKGRARVQPDVLALKWQLRLWERLSPAFPVFLSSGTTNCRSYPLGLGQVWLSYHFSTFVLVFLFHSVCVSQREDR